ncbi:MAG: hypothetical protein K8T10_04745 [Candidatus Eremiobacteraeota bacterium]|nr:hypothetical protein [Candidatus Eremiobacteraeota bacterium]
MHIVVDKSVLDFINVALKKENLRNIRTVLSRAGGVSLPTDSHDEVCLPGMKTGIKSILSYGFSIV